MGLGNANIETRASTKPTVVCSKLAYAKHRCRKGLCTKIKADWARALSLPVRLQLPKGKQYRQSYERKEGKSRPLAVFRLKLRLNRPAPPFTFGETKCARGGTNRGCGFGPGHH